MSHFSLIKSVQMEGLGGGRVVAPAFGDVQVTGVFDGRGDRGADGGQVSGPAAGPAGRGIFAEGDITDMMVRQCSRTRRARSGVVACVLVRLVMA